MRNRKVKNYMFLLFGLFLGSLCYGQNEVLTKIDGGASWSVAFNKPISVTSSTTDITFDESNYTVAIRHGTAVINLPAASDAENRIYVLINYTGSNFTIGGTYCDISSGTNTATSIPANSSVTLHSNGSWWYQIQ